MALHKERVICGKCYEQNSVLKGPDGAYSCIKIMLMRGAGRTKGSHVVIVNNRTQLKRASLNSGPSGVFRALTVAPKKGD